jgi:hypothetical protein
VNIPCISSISSENSMKAKVRLTELLAFSAAGYSAPGPLLLLCVYPLLQCSLLSTPRYSLPPNPIFLLLFTSWHLTTPFLLAPCNSLPPGPLLLPSSWPLATPFLLAPCYSFPPGPLLLPSSRPLATPFPLAPCYSFPPGPCYSFLPGPLLLPSSWPLTTPFL